MHPSTPSKSAPSFLPRWEDPTVSFSPLTQPLVIDLDPFSVVAGHSPLPLNPFGQLLTSPLAMKLSQIASDAADAECEAEAQSTSRLSMVAAAKAQQLLDSATPYQFTQAELEEMGDPMADLDESMGDDHTDSERLAEQKEDEAEEQLQVQDELRRAERDITKLRKLVPSFSTTAQPPPPSPRLPLPNPLPARPKPIRWVPPLPTPPGRSTSPSPSGSTRAPSKRSFPSTALTTLPPPLLPHSPSLPQSVALSVGGFEQHKPAPAWVVAAAAYLNEPALGTTWAECVSCWLKLGELTQYNDKVRSYHSTLFYIQLI